jgi:hypothetical protein
VLPIINRIFLRLDKRGALGDGNVLDWAVLARRPLEGSSQSRAVAAELL